MEWNETIQYLLEKGKITPEDIDEALMKSLTRDKKIDIESLHTAYCNLNHDNGECRWYDEGEDRVNQWKCQSHKHWADLFLAFITSAKLIILDPEAIAEKPTSSSDDPSAPSQGFLGA